LSSNRANASRRELIAGGLDPAKVVRVVGLADMIPFNADDLFDPTNRRISIVVMNRKTEQAVRAQGGGLDVNSTEGIDDEKLRQDIESQVAPAEPSSRVRSFGNRVREPS
jgi:chemotaxis protein MotB